MKRGPGGRSSTKSRTLTTSLGAIVLLAAGITIANYFYYHQMSVSSQVLTISQDVNSATNFEAQQDRGDNTKAVLPENPVEEVWKGNPILPDEETAQPQMNEQTALDTLQLPPETPEAQVETSEVEADPLDIQPKIPKVAGEFWSPGEGLQWRVSQHKRPTALKNPTCDPSKQAPNTASRPLNKLRRRFINPGGCSDLGLQSLCSGLSALASEWEVVVVAVSESQLREAAVFLDAAMQALTNLLPVALDNPSAHFLQSMGQAHYRYFTQQPPAVARWAVAADILSVGCGVLLADPTVVLYPDVFAYMYKDSDVEAMSLSSKEIDRVIRGKVVGIDDKDMGWSRYAQTMSVAMVSPGLVYLSPTGQSLELANTLAALPGPQTGAAVALAFNQHLFLPANNQQSRPGVTVRVMLTHCFCFGVAKDLMGRGRVKAVDMAGQHDPVQSMQLAVKPSGVLGAVTHLMEGLARRFGDQKKEAESQSIPQVTTSNSITGSRSLDEGKALVLQHGCEARKTQGPKPRPLNYLVAAEAEYPPWVECGKQGLMDLCKVVDKHHKNREMLVAVSNKNIFHMLGMYMDAVRLANVSNAMVVALDEETGRFCESRGFPYWVRTLKSRTGATDNHATSGLKFQILQDLISVGLSVLLSDVDIVWISDPFPRLYRDTDVEGMTDGWDDPTSYGWEWVSSTTGYPAPVHRQRNMRLSARNSGLFFLQATQESLAMMQRLKHRMATEDVWDQTAYNEEQFYVSYGGYATPGVSQRVMNYLCFMNSKALFRYVREDPDLYPDALRPVSVHVNYHPEKPQRMVDIIAQYHHGKPNAIGKWNWGVGLKIAQECMKRPGNQALLIRQSALAQRIVKASKVTWGGIKYVEFLDGGVLRTPWGDGKWGVLAPPAAAGGNTHGTFFADFAGAQHRLSMSQWPQWESARCSDDERVKFFFDA